MSYKSAYLRASEVRKAVHQQAADGNITPEEAAEYLSILRGMSGRIYPYEVFNTRRTSAKADRVIIQRAVHNHIESGVIGCGGCDWCNDQLQAEQELQQEFNKNAHEYSL